MPRNRNGAPGPGAEHPDQAGDPHRRQHRADQQQLERDEPDPAALRVPAGDRAGHVQLGPAVEGLPHQVGRAADDDHRRPRPQPARAQQPARPGQRDPDQQHGGQHADQRLVEQADPEREAGRQQQPVLPGAHRAGQQPGERGREQHVVRRGADEVSGDQRGGGHGRAGGGDELGPPPAAHLARGHPGQQHGGAGRERARQPHDDDGPAERVHQPGQDGGQRRLVGIAPVGVLAGHQEVELVAVEAVAPTRRDQQRDDRAGHREQRCPGETDRARRGHRMCLGNRHAGTVPSRDDTSAAPRRRSDHGASPWAYELAPNG